MILNDVPIARVKGVNVKMGYIYKHEVLYNFG